MNNHYQKIEHFLKLLPSEQYESCIKIMSDNPERFNISPGSKIKHQAWIGGYIDHLHECMSLGTLMYNQLSLHRTLPFSLGDVVLVLFIHDLEKPFKYTEPHVTFHDDLEKKNFIYNLLNEYKITLTPEQENAFIYIHGEGDEYNSDKNVQGPLAAFVHSLDTISARVWHEEPKKSGYLAI